jgi:hypothetical protein
MRGRAPSCCSSGHEGWFRPRICKSIDETVARELQLDGRRYWIISEPQGEVWKAVVVEMRGNDDGDEIGIEASAETRTAADGAAERKLRRLLGLPGD